MIKLTAAQGRTYNAIFEPSKPRWSEANNFEKRLTPIFGERIFPHFLHSHNEIRDLSYYFKNVILLTKFLTYLALEKEDDAVFHSFYHKIATACVDFLKTSLPEQKKDKGSIYTPEFEVLLHDSFFNSLCLKPGETDRVKALFSIKCAIAASTQLMDIYKNLIKKHGQHFVKDPTFVRLSTHTSEEITRAIDPYKIKTQEIIQRILVTQAIELDSKAINERLQQLAYKSSRTAAAKFAKYQLKEMSTYLNVVLLSIILIAFTIYQTGGDFATTALAMLFSGLLIVFSVKWDNSLEKKTKEVSILTQKIESDIAFDLARQQKELITQGVLEKQAYPIDTPKPSADNPVREKEEAEKPTVDYAMWFFGFSGLEPPQAFASKKHKAQSSPPSHPSFFTPTPLPAKKEELPPHYKRDSSGRLIFFNPEEVKIKGTSQCRIIPRRFAEGTYNVHTKSLSDNLKREGINDRITFKLKPQTRSNVRAYGITEEKTINGKSEEVCVVKYLLSKAHR